MSTLLKAPLSPFAPWADVVPGRGPVTVDILLTLPDDGYQYEVVEGVLVRVAGSGYEATTIAGVVLVALGSHVFAHRLGVVTPADGVYRFANAETGLIPDVGFFSIERRALIVDRKKPIPVAPDLAVEVASPGQQGDELAAKARTYLDGGTRMVWVVWPSPRQEVEVWRAGRSVAPVAVLGVGDTLDGEDVVPGFAFPVAAVFADPLAE